MRKIKLEPPVTRTWRRWLKDCERETRLLCAKVERGEPWAIKNLYKRKSIKTAYFLSKGPPFYGKCAYCETSIADFQHGDIDHFRPKMGVTNEHDRPVAHPGYYWLAYDWRNLLPTCNTCNQPSTIKEKKIGKHMRFPVVDRHAQTPDEVPHEQPLLIHPGSEDPADDPELHLTVDPRTGIMNARSERGEMCIEIFGLNLRDQLIEERRRAAREVSALSDRLNSQGNDLIALHDFVAIASGHRSFTMAQRAALAEEALFFMPILEEPQSPRPPEET